VAQSFRITGQKVILRTTNSSDIEDYKKWNNPDLKYTKFDAPWFGDDLTNVINQRLKWLESEKAMPYRHLEVDSISGDHIGWVAVYYKNNDPHMTEIGIDLPEDSYWGKGLGTEALRLWIDYLFNEYKLTRIGFSTWDGNEAVKVIGKKLGLVEECRIRKGCVVNSEFYDRIKMGILKEEWQNKYRSTK